MEKREVIAYAITHAPRGQKGGPYEGPCGIGRPVPTLAEAWRKRTRATVRRWLRAVRAVVPHARVIRIVRKAQPSPSEDATKALSADSKVSVPEVDPSPSEASAVAVLRELVAYDNVGFAYDSEPCGKRFGAIVDRARVVLAASGPDPSEVVRAALSWSEATAANGTARTVALQLACVAYRKAGGK